MAIIKCPECGRKISDKAPSCPHCGLVINKDLYNELHAEDPQNASENDEANKNISSNDETNKKKKGHNYTWLILVFFLIVIACCGAWFYMQDMKQQQEEEKYERVLNSNNSEMIQNYLDLHPDLSVGRQEQLTKKMTQLKAIDYEWQEAISKESRYALMAFIKKYPSDYRITEAKNKVDSLDWEKAKNMNSQSEYKAYMEHHSDGMFYDEAERRLHNLITEADMAKKEQELKAAQAEDEYEEITVQYDSLIN